MTDSEVGASVSQVGERSPLLQEVNREHNSDHYMFIMRWNVSGFKLQSHKRTLVNLLSILMRYGGEALDVLDVHNPDEYTGYAIYYDDARVWLVARLLRKVNHLIDSLITAIVNKDVIEWNAVPGTVKCSLSMFGELVYHFYAEGPKPVNFERVLRSYLLEKNDYMWDALLFRKSFLPDPVIDDYFEDDYKVDLFSQYNLIHYWSVTKRNEWIVTRPIKQKNDCKRIKL